MLEEQQEHLHYNLFSLNHEEIMKKYALLELYYSVFTKRNNFYNMAS
jgi:hypothetical protein